MTLPIPTYIDGIDGELVQVCSTCLEADAEPGSDLCTICELNQVCTSCLEANTDGTDRCATCVLGGDDGADEDFEARGSPRRCGLSVAG
jgi:hypothetical protein